MSNSPKKRLLGAHMSSAGGRYRALERMAEMGGNCVQLFSASPRGWSTVVPEAEESLLFRDKSQQLGIASSYFHASYLINLADAGEVGQKSITTLQAELTLASVLGVRGSIVHLGSFKDTPPQLYDVSQERSYSTLIHSIHTVLARVPKDVFFIIENAGNKKIGQTFAEIGAIVRDVADERVKVCLDTCHLFAAGYNITTADSIDDILEQFNTHIGLNRLELIHLNDSRDPFASGRDRHENIGKGSIGLSSFRSIINHPSLSHLPFILEVPGLAGQGPDKYNLDLITSLISDSP